MCTYIIMYNVRCIIYLYSCLNHRMGVFLLSVLATIVSLLMKKFRQYSEIILYIIWNVVCINTHSVEMNIHSRGVEVAYLCVCIENGKIISVCLWFTCSEVCECMFISSTLQTNECLHSKLWWKENWYIFTLWSSVCT